MPSIIGPEIFNSAWAESKRHNVGNLYYLYPGLREDPETSEFLKWYQGVLDTNLPLERTVGPITNKIEWTHETDAEGELTVVRRHDGKFYEFVGITITKTGKDGNTFTYTQPAQVMVETPLVFEMYGTEDKYNVNGILVVDRDDQGRVLVTLAPESMSENPKAISLLLGYQASAGKMALWMGETDPGKRELIDRAMTAMMKARKLDSPFELLVLGRKFPGLTGDPNGVLKHNVIVKPEVVKSSDPLHEQLTQGGGMWLSEHQLRVALSMGLTNEHLVAAVKQVLDDDILTRDFGPKK